MIGEKLNIHAYKKVRKAVERKDTKTVLDIARDQIQQGADVLDIHGGGIDDQLWLLRTVSELGFPMTVDNMDAAVVRASLDVGEVKFINSIGEGRLDLFKDAEERGVSVIGLLYNISADEMLSAADEHGFDRSRLYLDPAVQSVGADPSQGPRIIKDHRELKEKPKVKTVAGIGNVSHMMPGHATEINAALLISLMQDGLDAAIINVEKLGWYVRALDLFRDGSGKALMHFLKTYRSVPGK